MVDVKVTEVWSRELLWWIYLVGDLAHEVSVTNRATQFSVHNDDGYDDNDDEKDDEEDESNNNGFSCFLLMKYF